MHNKEYAAKAWNSAALPVIVLEKNGGVYVPFYQNDAAAALCPCGFLTDCMPDKLAQAILSGRNLSGQDDASLFFHTETAVYYVVTFAWEDCRVCMLTDVSSYYKSHQKALNEAIMASQAKTSFLSEMSHDIRTPMGAIIGMTDIALMQEQIPPRVRECLNKIKVASGHLMSLLNEVLDMSRIESGRILIQEEDTDIADLLHEVLTVANPQAEAARLHFSVNLGRMAEERILADSVRLKQICLNLLSNAIKFTPEGGSVTMDLEITPADSRGRVHLKLQVKDTGIGMSPEFLQKVFVPFEREEKSTVNKIQGTGLGMAITKNLVDLMGGQITVASKVQEGTCFQVDIPFVPGQNDRDIYRNVLKGRHILLFDGDEAQSAGIIEMLRNVDLAVDWARNAEQTVDFINEMAFSDEEYFAMLTTERAEDVEMLLFLPQIRQRMGADFPIFLLSEHDWSQLEYVYTQAGVTSFIPLPLFSTRLCAGLYAYTREGQEEERQNSENQNQDFHGKRILLAEDNEINREIAMELLGMMNLQIDTVENGRLAVDRFRETSPDYYDMILMDIQMPVMNGLDAARAIRSLPCSDARDIPIVAMTANAFVEDVKNSMDAGMNAHIAKPLDMNQVYATLEMFLGKGNR